MCKLRGPVRAFQALFLGSLLATACSRGEPREWERTECETLSLPQRDECLAAVLPALFAESRDQGEAWLEKVTDTQVRDYVLLEITRSVDATTRRYCNRISAEDLREGCLKLVQRPHLHP